MRIVPETRVRRSPAAGPSSAPSASKRTATVGRPSIGPPAPVAETAQHRLAPRAANWPRTARLSCSARRSRSVAASSCTANGWLRIVKKSGSSSTRSSNEPSRTQYLNEDGRRRGSFPSGAVARIASVRFEAQLAVSPRYDKRWVPTYETFETCPAEPMR